MSKKKRRPAKKITRSKPITDKYRTDKYVEYIFTAELSLLNADTILPKLTELLAQRFWVAAILKLGEIASMRGMMSIFNVNPNFAP